MKPRVEVAAGLVAVLGLLTACSPAVDEGGGDEGNGNRGEPAATGAADRLPADLAGAAEVFGPGVTAQDDGAFGLDRWTLVDDRPPGGAGRAMRVFFPAGSVSPSATREHGSPEGGMQVFLPLLPRPVETAHLRYWVRFPDDFQFVKGGKLPGLYGGTEVSGGEEPDGTDGFSTRLMWRAGGDGELYLYAAGESGTSLGRGDWTWSRGSWTCVEQRVVLNDPEADDASVTVWVDGDEVLSLEGMTLRTVPDLRIDGVFFSTFFGGADPDWAPATDQHLDFAGFAVAESRIGCSS